MPKNTRYDRFAQLISRDFEQSRTFTTDITTANGRDILVDGHAEGWREDNSTFAQFRPYNALSVENTSASTMRVYLSRQQDTWFDVGSGESRSLEVSKYFSYVEIEEQDGTAPSADDVQATVAKVVDSRELELLKMAGMLNVQGD